MSFTNEVFERSVLGFYLAGYSNASEALKSEVDIQVHDGLFAEPNNIRLWREIKSRFDVGVFDILTIDSSLKNECWYINAGGFGWLGDITTSNMRSSSVPGHIKELDLLYRERETFNLLQSVTRSLTANAPHSEKMEIVADALSKSANLMSQVSSEEKTINTAMDKILAFIDERQSNGGETGLKTGLNAIDNAMGERGIGKTDFIVIGARPKTGKTLTSLKVTSNLAMNGKKILFFSLEMDEFELGTRLMANASAMSPSDIYGDVSDNNDEFWANVSASVAQLKDSGIYIEDTPGLKIQQVKAIAKKINSSCGGLDGIVVDYLQKMGVNDKGRHDLAVGEISGGLKNLAKEIQVPVIALSQLNRSGTGKPNIKELRESGQIEQDADAIFLMHNMNEDNDGNPTNPIVEINMPAYRHGPSAPPSYLDKTFGKIKDADPVKVHSLQMQVEENSTKRPGGFQFQPRNRSANG